MKKADCVEVIVEKEKYSKEGIHKGMQGKTLYMERGFDCWCVSFSECSDKSREIRLPIDTEDLKYLPNGITPKRNEEIKRKFGEFIEGDGLKNGLRRNTCRERRICERWRTQRDAGVDLLGCLWRWILGS